MTIKEAILKTLTDLGASLDYKDILTHIQEQNYYDFENDINSKGTISSVLSDLIKDSDPRVQRIKGEHAFLYFATSKKDSALKNTLFGVSLFEDIITGKFYERDLHPFLSTYLLEKNILPKTIFHERSDNDEDKNQKWIHPDMVSVNFTKFKCDTSSNFLKAVNVSEAFNISSYELKKEILTDYDLKKFYFQAVSNSSWANYGYLVAMNINSSLLDEIGRLNESFGIGVIELSSNPSKTRVLFPAQHKKLDIRTIDKLSLVNKDFKSFINYIEELLSADKKYLKGLERELNDFCDSSLGSEKDVLNYCKNKKIPFSD